MTSEIPKKPNTSHNGAFVGLAVAMLLTTGGLIVWKMTRSSEPEPSAPATTAAPEEEAPVRANPPPPPPPEEETTAKPTAQAVAAPAAGKASASPCVAECSGEATASLKQALAARGGQGRRCYEKTLAQNSTLSGKMTIHLKIAPNGSVCSANVGSDTLRDPGLTTCILGVFRSSTFPAPQGGCVEADVPLNFVPNKQ